MLPRGHELRAEVLSPSTADYDRGRKFTLYHTLGSLQEYLLVASDPIQADLYTCQPGGMWVPASAEGPEGILSPGSKVELESEWTRVVPTQPAPRPGEKGDYMPMLTAEKRKELGKLAARPDREIDLTDIPEILEIPSDAVIGKFYRPKKNHGDDSPRCGCSRADKSIG